MDQPNKPEDTAVSSKAGRQWLNKSKHLTREDAEQADTSSSDDESVSPTPIHEPLASIKQGPSIQFPAPQTPVEPTTDGDALPFESTNSLAVVETPAPIASEPGTLQFSIPFAGAKAASALEAIETTDDTGSDEMVETAAVADPAVVASRTSAGDPNCAESSIGNLVDQILERFPSDAPAIIAFHGSETSVHTDETCARVAAELVGRDVGKVLLIDADCEHGRLTHASETCEKPGVSDVIQLGFNWRAAVLSGSGSALDFLPLGTLPQVRWYGPKSAQKLAAEVKGEYGYVCVSVGDAHQAGPDLWSGISDGSYLLVSVETSNPDVAQSAVVKLRAQGSRLLGCVVTDCE